MGHKIYLSEPGFTMEFPFRKIVDSHSQTSLKWAPAKTFPEHVKISFQDIYFLEPPLMAACGSVEVTLLKF